MIERDPMNNKQNRSGIFRAVFIATLIFAVAGCSIKLGPDPVRMAQSANPGLARLGDVTESVTGTWNIYPTSGVKSQFLTALKKPEAAAFFSGGIDSLIMDVQLTSDHESDHPRLSSLGALSMLTIGIIPLSYHSEWNIQCKVTLKNSSGAQVGIYNITEKGTYDIWAYPLTMFSLFGAGVRGESDWQELSKRTCESLVNKIMESIGKDYQTLSSRSGGSSQASSFTPLQQGVIV